VPTPSIGQYALFCVRPGTKKYAARIDGREGRMAILTWHSGNVYAAKDTPTSSTFSRFARECTEALDDAGLNAVPKSKVSFLHKPQKTHPNCTTGRCYSVAAGAPRRRLRPRLYERHDPDGALRRLLLCVRRAHWASTTSPHVGVYRTHGG
jgi:hypothetical protein